MRKYINATSRGGGDTTCGSTQNFYKVNKTAAAVLIILMALLVRDHHKWMVNMSVYEVASVWSFLKVFHSSYSAAKVVTTSVLCHSRLSELSAILCFFKVDISSASQICVTSI